VRVNHAVRHCVRNRLVLLGNRKRQHEQQGDDAFQGNGKQRGESAELLRLRQQLAQVTMERDVLKRFIAMCRRLSYVSPMELSGEMGAVALNYLSTSSGQTFTSPEQPELFQWRH